MRLLKTFLVCAVAAAGLAGTEGCASHGSPPGGPPDSAPPVLLRTAPDSGTTGVTPPRVVFRFDEVVSERPRGVASLERLFLISPRDGEPRVDWRREEIHVRPRNGWRPNTVYSVTMLPGLTDLRGNVNETGATLVFSTGAGIPDTRIAGVIFDWGAGRPIQRAWVEAFPANDTTRVFATYADSAGRFAFRHLQPGVYGIRGVHDQNNNRGVDPREPYDSVGVVLHDSVTVELLAFVHDTVGPRIESVTARDSLTLRVTFDQLLRPDQPLTEASFALLGSDSVAVPVSRAMFAPDFERQLERERAAADTAARQPAAPRDTADTAAAGPSRPPPARDVVIVLARPLAPAEYRLRAADVQNLLGARRSSERVFQVR